MKTPLAILAAFVIGFAVGAALGGRSSNNTAASPPPSVATAPAVKPAAAPSPVPTAQVSEAPVTFSGFDRKNTAPFNLAGGTYLFAWRSQPDASPGACSMYLRGASNGASDLLVNLVVREPKSDHTYVYNVRPGPYYVEIDGCDTWNVEITRQ